MEMKKSIDKKADLDIVWFEIRKKAEKDEIEKLVTNCGVFK
jgi:hypothetical protein